MNDGIPSHGEVATSMAAVGADVNAPTQGQANINPAPSQIAAVNSDVNSTEDSSFWDSLTATADLDAGVTSEVSETVEQAPVEQPYVPELQAQQPQSVVQQVPQQPQQAQMQAQPQQMQPQGQLQPMPQQPQGYEQVQQPQQGYEQPVQQQQSVDIEGLRDAAINQLSGSVYALTQEEGDAIATTPETALPQLAARMHVNIVQSLGETLAAQIPQQVLPIIQEQMRAQNAERSFYSQHSDLDNPQYKDTVNRAMATVRQMNPTLGREQLMDGAANLARQTLGLPQNQMPVRQVQQQQPAQQVAQQQTSPVPQQPYSPSAAQAAPGLPAVPTQPNNQTPWGELADDPNFW